MQTRHLPAFRSTLIAVLVIFSGLVTLLFPRSVEAVACNPPESGNYTLSGSCTFPNSSEGNSVDGVFQGDMIIPEGTTLTINAGQTVCFDPDGQVLLQGGNIAINETGQLKECSVNEEMMGNLNLDTYGPDTPARIYGNNLFVCTSNPCTATSPAGSGNVIVEGALQMLGGTPGAGKVLTSDANGVASWQTTSGNDGWTDDGSTVRLTTITDLVGIGTTNAAGFNLRTVGQIVLANTVITGEGVEINTLGSGNRYGWIDLHGDDTYTDFSARLIRANTGVNAITQIEHRGTGALQFNAFDAGSIQLLTSNTPRMTFNSTGAVGVGTTSPSRSLHVEGGTSRMRFNTGTNQSGTTHGQLRISNDSSGLVWISFHREGVYAAQFGLESDNWLSTRGWSAGTSGYTNLKVRDMAVGFATQAWLQFMDTNTNDWMLTTGGAGGDQNFYFFTDTNGDGAVETAPVILTFSTVALNGGTNYECAACVDQGDLKTTTGSVASAVTMATQFSPSEYTFFPNMDQDDCAVNGARVLRPYPGNAGNIPVPVFWIDQGCSSGSWDLRFRYVTASRDPEIFGWYDPENDIIQAMWIAEISPDHTDQLPASIKNEEHPTWIPVQATLFDRDLARYGEKIDIDTIMRNYTFTRVAKADRLKPDDELIESMREEHDRCLTAAQAEIGRFDNPEGKCPQFITNPDVYYGKLEWSDEVPKNWERHEAEKTALAQANKFITGSDLAENYVGAADVTPGEIIAIDRAQNNFLVRATAAESQQLAGVVSTSPGQTLGNQQEENVTMALVGRVPVKMSPSSLPVKPGDMITISSEAGKGAKATQAGWVVGKALEAWEPNSGKETVLVLLNTSVYDPQLVQKSLDGYTLAKQTDGTFRLLDVYQNVVDRVAAVKDAMIGSLQVGILKVSRLELAGVDVGTQLTQLERRLQVAKVAQARVNRPAQAVGSSTLPKNDDTIFVSEPRVTGKTTIFLTSRVATENHLVVTEIQPGSGFTVSAAEAGQEIPFDYWLVK